MTGALSGCVFLGFLASGWRLANAYGFAQRQARSKTAPTSLSATACFLARRSGKQKPTGLSALAGCYVAAGVLPTPNSTPPVEVADLGTTVIAFAENSSVASSC